MGASRTAQLEALLYDVREMIKLQQQFFKTRDYRKLDRCKAYESRVLHRIEQLDNPKLDEDENG